MQFRQRAFAFLGVALFVCDSSASAAQRRQPDKPPSDRDITVLVTAHPHGDRKKLAAAKIRAEDFVVREDGSPQQIISVKRASDEPLTIALLIQDDLVLRVNNEIDRIKEFIRNLPEGSRILVGYVTTGTLRVVQDFTTDRERAASSLRAVKGTEAGAPYNPYVEVVEALRKFDTQPIGRRVMILISDGLDASHGFRSASPAQSVDLDRAVSEAQRRSVAISSFYAPTVESSRIGRIEVNYGQGSLMKLADETGGEAFINGTDFVSFDSYFKEFEALFPLQWLITYQSSTIGRSFRRLEITTEQDVHLHYADGYKPR